jgi:hypothetical protein
MPSVLSVSLCTLFLLPAAMAFIGGKPIINAVRPVNMVSVAQQKAFTTIDAPDFYWEYRLERLSSKFSSEIKFSPSNYPDVSGFKDLYDAYYLDLTLQGVQVCFILIINYQ